MIKKSAQKSRRTFSGILLVSCCLALSSMAPSIAQAYAGKMISTNITQTLLNKSVAQRQTMLWNSYPASVRGNLFTTGDGMSFGSSSGGW